MKWAALTAVLILPGCILATKEHASTHDKDQRIEMHCTGECKLILDKSDEQEDKGKGVKINVSKP